MNKKQLELMNEFMQKRAYIQEEMLWIGCNPDNPEMFKQQSRAGFEKMHELSRLAVEYKKKIDSAGDKIDYPKNVDIPTKPLIYANQDKDDLK